MIEVFLGGHAGSVPAIFRQRIRNLDRVGVATGFGRQRIGRLKLRNFSADFPASKGSAFATPCDRFDRLPKPLSRRFVLREDAGLNRARCIQSKGQRDRYRGLNRFAHPSLLLSALTSLMHLCDLPGKRGASYPGRSPIGLCTDE